ncbi:F-box/LRR-repeat protein 2 [Planoprotostelium fungivorum]|uniref:F-box/LRR-repeat protein 2 n=1 Tax=Planoprotostelium fungivorum TaxID=1890364 RepID=A0A2P6MPF9_9EUKA|nr:F-box/LRR-repeat protein 2 [Planoprotostelium fungivorum]
MEGDEITSPERLYDLTLQSIHRNINEIVSDFSILPTGVIEEVLQYLMEERKLGSRALNLENVTKFLVPTLTELDINNFWVEDLPFEERGVYNLRLVNFNKCLHVTDKSLFHFGQHCHQLRSLRLSGCRDITTKGLNSIANGCPHLNEFEFDATDVEDEGLSNVLRNCRQLKELIVHKARNISFHCIAPDLSKLADLQTLHLEQITLIDSQVSVLERIDKLRLVDCSGLQQPNFSHCTNLTSIYLESLDIKKIRLPDGEKLKSIEIVHCQFIKNLEFLEDNLEHLAVLRIRECKRLQPTDILWLCDQLPEAKKLIELDLSDIRAIINKKAKDNKGEPEKMISRPKIDCSSLEVIKWSYLFSKLLPFPILNTPNLLHAEITDADIERICSSCPNLEQLSLETCPHVSDQSVTSISEHLKSLLYLNIGKCERLKNPSVSLPQLRNLLIHWTHARSLHFDCPRLVVLDVSGHEEEFMRSLSPSFSRSGAHLEKIWARSTAGVFEGIKEHCPKMVLMDWSQSTIDATKALEDIIEGLPKYQLRKVYLTSASFDPGERLIKLGQEKQVDIVWRSQHPKREIEG